MRKPAQRVTPDNDTAPIVIKNPFLVAKLEKAARRMGWSMNEAIIFFVHKGFDKPFAFHRFQRMEAVQGKLEQSK